MFLLNFCRGILKSVSGGTTRQSQRRDRIAALVEGLEERTLLSAFAEFVDPNPAAGNQFSATVVALSTGNVVVTAPYDSTAAPFAGAVYLFNGATGALISTMTGTQAQDQIGSDGVTALANGNFVVRSSRWDNGAIADAGAVTWGNGVTGFTGAVSAANSLVGSTLNDYVGRSSITPLTNGNYAVLSDVWDNGTVADVGALTWGNGATGSAGAVSAANSLIGSTASDLNLLTVKTLDNGNYVATSLSWDNGAATDAGAVTWGSGIAGVAGAISAANSLIGDTVGGQVRGGFYGEGGVTALTNGNYVVCSTDWSNGAVTHAGAVTWGSGTAGIIGIVGTANSLVGSTANDAIGSGRFFGGGRVIPLSNGNYVVSSPDWDNGAVANVGAITWGNGYTGSIGTVSAANSLVGSKANDTIGIGGLTALSNGNFAVSSPLWDNGAIFNAGAVTWQSGASSNSAVVGAANSLVGLAYNNYLKSPLVLDNINDTYIAQFTNENRVRVG